MDKIILEDTLSPDTVDVEDGGRAIICTLNVDVSENAEDEGIYARIISWSENKNHADINKFIGKRVRVTIETLD